jgi:hypothetical protein
MYEKLPKINFPSFKRRGKVEGIYSVLYNLCCTKIPHGFAEFNTLG